MQTIENQIRATLRSDIDPEFLRALSVGVGWAYQDLFEDIVAHCLIGPAGMRREFGHRRASAVESAIVRVCRDRGIPFDWRRLDYNGQDKLIVKCGRVLLIHEAIPLDRRGPVAADYKRALVGTHNITRQLELDLGDIPGRIHDWSGDIVATILHGAAGHSFDAKSRGLGVLRIGVADGSYDSWIVNHDVTDFAMEGRPVPDFGTEENQEQTDRTRVVLRRHAKLNEKRK